MIAPSPDPQDDTSARLASDAMWAAFGLPVPLRPDQLAAAFVRALQRQPEATRRAVQELYDRQWALWQSALSTPAPVTGNVDPGGPSTRHPWFAYLRAQHRLWDEWSQTFGELLALPPGEHRQLMFALKQAIDASDPDNTFATNPQALQRAVDTGGDSVVRGIAHLSRDLARGRITMSAGPGFTLGVDIAATPGSVVHASPIAQLLHYRAEEPRVRTVPLLVVPPFINKYYILDLRPGSSFVRFATSQGFDVFLLSWADPDPATIATWDDYVDRGMLDALDEIGRITGEPRAHVLGYCVGGTLAATALAVDAARGRDRVASLTLLATLLDFTEVGDIGVYIDEASVTRFEADFARGGIMDGSRLAAAFASLRARELIWHFVRHNYLLGEDTPANDFLHWNGDETAVPGPLFAFYLRHMYRENRLVVANALSVCGHPVDLRRLTLDAYVLAARGDHIVPWQSAFDSGMQLGATPRFVLAQSGHVAGIVNPPEPARRGYWTGRGHAATAAQWFDTAQPHTGSWWHDWAAWLGERSGRWRPVRSALRRQKTLEPAPGTYVVGRGATGAPDSHA